MDIQEQIAWTIRNDCGKYIREGRSIAAAIMPLVRRAQAVAWEEAVRSMRYEDGTPVEIVAVVNPFLEKEAEG